MGRYTGGGIGRDMLAGALAGAAAVWVVQKLDWSLYRAGGPERIRQTEAARPGGMDPAHVLAAKAADKLGVDIGDRKDNAAGRAVYYGFGIGMGALYGVLRGMCPAVSAGRGALFGLAMFILKDEVGNTVMGTGGNPLDYPIQDHARGAAGHAVFGLVTDLGTRLLAPWRDEVVVYQGPPLSERIEQGRQYVEQGRQYVGEQGRGYLEQGRRLVEQGLEYADKYGRRYLQQGREAVDQGREYAEQGRRHARDYARKGQRAAEDYAERGRRTAQDYAEQGGTYAERARRQAGRFADQATRYASQAADEVRSRAPDASDVRRAKGWFSSLFG